MKHYVIITLLLTSVCFAQYSLNVQSTGGAKHAGEQNKFRAHLMKGETVIKTFERNIPFDVPFPATYVQPSTGLTILSFIFDGFVEVYNAQGDMIWKRNFFKEMGPNYERTITIAVGTSTIAFLTSDVTLPYAIVHLFKADGTPLWKTELPSSMGYEISMSPDETLIAAGSYALIEDTIRQSSTILTNTGAIEGSVDLLFRKAAFSGDNTLIALTSEKEIAVYSKKEKKAVSRSKKGTEGIITDVQWDGEALVVQESEIVITPEHQFLFANPTFTWYSEQLHPLSEQRLKHEPFKTSALTVKDSVLSWNVNERSFPLIRKR